MNNDDAERNRIPCAAMEFSEYAGWQARKVESLLSPVGVRDRSHQRDSSDGDGPLAALREDELRNVSGQLREAATPGKSPAQRIHAYTAALIDCGYPAASSARPSLLASIWLAQCARSFDLMDQLTEELIHPLRKAITDGCQLGTVSSQNPDADAQAIFHLILGLVTTQAATSGPTSRGYVQRAIDTSVTRALDITEQ